MIENRYEVQSPAVTVGCVELYDAVDRQLERPVTLQLLNLEASVDPVASSMFLRNQQIASSVHDRSLFAVYDAGSYQGRPYSIMAHLSGVPVESLHRPGHPPDAGQAVRLGRQTAEAVGALRTARLADWTLTNDAVWVDAEGNACVAVIECLPAGAEPAGPAGDVSAITRLMKTAVSGDPAAAPDALGASFAPGWFVDLVSRLEVAARSGGLDLATLASQLREIEEAAGRPTEAYHPATVGAPVAAAPTAISDVPRAAPLLDGPPRAGVALTRPLDSAPPGGVETPRADGEPGVARRASSAPIWLLVVVVGLLALLLAIALPRLMPSRALAAVASPVTSPGPAPAGAPDFRGKSLADAQSLAAASRLKLATGAGVPSTEYAAGVVAAQDPAPGGDLPVAGTITVSLSLGPQTPTPATVPEVAPTVAPTIALPSVQPAPVPPGHEKPPKKKGKGH